MNILVINCGSSSLKFQLIDMTTEAVQAKGLCERIGIDGSRIVYTPAGGEKMTIESPMPTHTEAIKLVLDCLTNAEYGVIKSLKEINAVGHRQPVISCHLLNDREKFQFIADIQKRCRLIQHKDIRLLT